MATSEPVRTSAPHVHWRIVALTVLALALRVVFLGHKGLWQDEVFSVLFARPSNPDFWPVLKTAEANMALYYILLRQWMHYFTSDAAVRFLSVIPGVLTIPAVYALGARLYSRRVAMWAAGLITVNACAVVYSQEARGYSLLVLFVALSSCAFLRFIERPSLMNWLMYTAFSICAFYSHFYAAFVILAQLCALFLLPTDKVPWKSLITSWGLIAIAAVPGLRVVFLSHGSNLWWVPRPGLLEIYRTFTFLAAENGKALGAILGVLLLIPIGFASGAAWKQWRSGGKSIETFRSAFAVVGLFGPLAITMLLSLWHPMFFHRFLIICLVPFLLLAAVGLDGMRNRSVRLALALSILLLSCVTTELSYLKVREDWRGAAAFSLGASGDPVIFYIKDAAAPFAYYRERLGSPMTTEQAIRLDSSPSSDQAAAWSKAYPRVWVVRFPSSPKDTIEPQIATIIGHEYKLCERRDFKAISVSQFTTGICPAK
jgi:uncharacterized membrane protein